MPDARQFRRCKATQIAGRTIACKQGVFLDVTYGEYRARCGYCITFRATPPGIEIEPVTLA